MGEANLHRRADPERLREFFEVQLKFAEIYASRTSRSLSDVCLRYTNLHWRLGFGTANDSVSSPQWLAYADVLDRCVTTADRLDWTIFSASGNADQGSDEGRFGCFRFDAPTADGVVRIHFGNRDTSDGCGPLAAAKTERRLSELREMFGAIRAGYPSARQVRGSSWLYNISAYRRLFPAVYGASTREPAQARLNGTSSWGQVLDHKGGVKRDVSRVVLENIRIVDVDSPWRAFPLRVLGAEASIEHFYRFYRL